MSEKRRVIESEYGSKPDFLKIVKTNKDHRSLFWRAMTYAHYELSANDLKKEVVKYLRKIESDLVDAVIAINEGKFISIGKYLYIINNGGEIPELENSKFLERIQTIIDCHHVPPKIEIDTKKSTATIISIQDRIRERAYLVSTEVDLWLDAFTKNKKLTVKTVEDFLALFAKFELKSQHMRFIISDFESQMAEVDTAVDGKDDQIVEGYSNFSKAELKKFQLLFRNLMKACEMMQETAKVARAPRKKKPVSLEKMTAKMKYKKEDIALGLVSINPKDIPGSKELWVYNTKTRKISQYKAKDESGLGVKGTSILNFSIESAEKTLRKPGEALAEFKKASKVKLRTFLKELTTVDTPAQGKINEHHIILRVDK